MDFGEYLPSHPLVLLVLLFLLQHWCSCHSLSSTMCDWRTETQKPLDDPSEDVIIGEFVSVTLAGFIMETFVRHPQDNRTAYLMPKNYQHILAFAFALHEINQNAELLPNTTLGYKIYDNAFDSWRACRTTLDLLFLGKGNPVNYKCGRTEETPAVIGGLISQTSMQMAHILNVYSIPQISYGAFDSRLSDNIQFPFLYRMIPSEDPQYTGIVLLLEHFGWNWIGLVVSEDDIGETFLQTLRPKLLQSHICIAQTIMIPRISSFLPEEIENRKMEPILLAFLLTEINVMLVHGDRQALEGLRFVLDIYEFNVMKPQRKVWVTTAQWDYTALTAGIKLTSKSLNGTLSFALHTNMVPGFEDFLENINPFHSNLYSVHWFWSTLFACSLPLHGQQYPDGKNCTGQEKFANLPGSLFEMGMSGHSYGVYNAVYFVAHALDAIYSLRAKQKGKRDEEKQDPPNIYPWQVKKPNPEQTHNRAKPKLLGPPEQSSQVSPTVFPQK